MLARTPDEARVYQAYLQALATAGDQAEFERIKAVAQEKFGPGPAP